MNMTTFFYCNCGYEKALNEGEGYMIAQCNRCNTLASAEKKFHYTLTCSACGKTEKVEENVSFEQEKTCDHCNLKGNVGIKEVHTNTLFHIESHLALDEKCDKCRKIDWKKPEQDDFSCPMCFQPLKQKMSNYWEE